MTAVTPETAAMRKKRKLIKAKVEFRNKIWAGYGACLFLIIKADSVCFMPSTSVTSGMAENASEIFHPLDKFPTCPDVNLGVVTWHRANSKLMHGQYFVISTTVILATATRLIVPKMNDDKNTKHKQAHIWRISCIKCIINGVLEIWYCKKGLSYMYGTKFVLGENTRIDLDEYDDAYIPSFLLAGLGYFGISLISLMELCFQSDMMEGVEDEKVEVRLEKDHSKKHHVKHGEEKDEN